MSWLPYEGKLRIFLVLLVLLMVLLVFFQTQVFLRAQAALREEAMQRIRLVTAAMAGTLEKVERGKAVEPVAGRGAAAIRRLVRGNGLLAVDLIGERGEILWSTLSSRVGQFDIRAASADSILMGRIFLPVGDQVGPYASRFTYLAAGGNRWRLEHPTASLDATRQRLRTISWIQASSILLALVSVLWFARWTLRPYRQLLSVVGRQTGGPAPPRTDLPAFLVDSFRGTVQKLEAQERELMVLRDRAREPLAGAMLERMASGFFRLDPDGSLVEVNSAAERLLGRDRRDLLEKDYGEVAGPATRLREILRSALEEQRSWSREVVPYARPDGAVSHLGVSACPVVANGRGTAGAVCLLTDLTEIRAVEERVRNRETLAMVGEWSAGMAHEFRNSLGTILGVARLLERKIDAKQREWVREILREVETSSRAVEDFLHLARPARLQLGPVDLGRFLGGLASRIEKEFPGKVRFRLEGEFPSVRADPDLLHQAFQNLFRNAAQANGNGHGPVQVEIRSIPGGDPGRLRLEITDDGKGIPAEDLPHIFTPFYTTRAGGTGLGLPLARKAILSHDGDLSVECPAAGGTRFAVELPLALDPVTES